MEDSYFFVTMNKMETRRLQDWLREAQIGLLQAEGAKKELLEEGIRCCAGILLQRFREWKQTLSV